MRDYEKDIGKTFGRLTVDRFYKKNNHWVFDCTCKCGNKKTATTSSIINGYTQSCGCLWNEKRRERDNCDLPHIKHLRNIMRGMKRRCNPTAINNPKYKHYAGRGISVCKEWTDDFMNFYEWAIHNGYQEGLTIDRIDVNGNYCPENCRWADYKIQANNTTRNHFITYKGETKTVSEWADELGVNYHSLLGRVLKGMSIEDAFLKKIGSLQPARKLTYKGVTKDIHHWASETGLSETLIYKRLKKGLSIERTLTMPAKGPIYIKCKGETHNLKEWSNITGLSSNTIYQRYCKGLSLDDVLKEEEQKIYTFNGKSLTLKEWAKEINVPIKTLKKRLERKWTLEKALTMPYHPEFATATKRGL